MLDITQTFHGSQPFNNVNPCTGGALDGTESSNMIAQVTFFPSGDELWATFTEEDNFGATDDIIEPAMLLRAAAIDHAARDVLADASASARQRDTISQQPPAETKNTRHSAKNGSKRRHTHRRGHAAAHTRGPCQCPPGRPRTRRAMPTNDATLPDLNEHHQDRHHLAEGGQHPEDRDLRDCPVRPQARKAAITESEPRRRPQRGL